MGTSYTLIDYFNGFQQLKRIKRFSAGVQSTYFAILGEFNLRRFPAELELSTRDLKSLAGLKSVSSAHEARNILKNNKLVDFHNRNGISTYSLGTEHLPNTYRTATEHYGAEMPNGNRTPHALSISSVLSTQMETETKRQDKDTPQPPQGAGGAGAHDSLRGVELPPIGEDSDIFKVWVKEARIPLNARQRYELADLAESENYGFAKVKAAIEKMADSRSYQSYDAFKEILEGKQKPKLRPLKGGETSGGQSIYQYELPPADNGNEPWAKY